MYQIVGETELQLDCEALTLWCLNLEAQKALEEINRALAQSPFFFLISSWDGDLEFFFLFCWGGIIGKQNLEITSICLKGAYLFFIITLFNLTVFLQYMGMVSLMLSLDSQECMFFIILLPIPGIYNAFITR